MESSSDWCAHTHYTYKKWGCCLELYQVINVRADIKLVFWLNKFLDLIQMSDILYKSSIPVLCIIPRHLDSLIQTRYIPNLVHLWCNHPKYLHSKTNFINAKILILWDKTSIFAFMKILRDNCALIFTYLADCLPLIHTPLISYTQHWKFVSWSGKKPVASHDNWLHVNLAEYPSQFACQTAEVKKVQPYDGCYYCMTHLLMNTQNQ